MTGPARWKWLHGIEPGESIVLSADKCVKRTTRFALLLTTPMETFVGAALVRHGALRGGGKLVSIERGRKVASVCMCAYA